MHDSLAQLSGGAISGAVTKTITAPLERIKILLQVQGVRHELKPSDRYKGIGSTIGRIFAEDGFRGFWKGNTANIVRVVPTYALKFALNDRFKMMIAAPGQTIRDLSTRQLIGAGWIAGFTQYLTTYPLELVRTRLSLSEQLAAGARYTGMWDCARQTIRFEGFHSLYKGLGITLLSGPTYVSFQMTFYQLLKNRFSKSDGEISSVQRMGMGAAAGVAAQSFMYPGDTIKRQLQSNGMNNTKRQYSGTLDAIRSIYSREGMVGFYRGFGAGTIRVLPAAAIQFAVYDIVVSQLIDNDESNK